MVEMALKDGGKEKLIQSFQSRTADYSYRKKKVKPQNQHN